MNMFMRSLKLTPPDLPSYGNELEGGVNESAKLPRLLFAAPCLGGMLLIIWSPSVGGIAAALGWTCLSLILATGVFAVAQYRVLQLLPAITKTETSHIAGFCMAPVWIAEVFRMVLAAGFILAGKWEPIAVFRDILTPAKALGNAAELITVVGLAVTLMRLYFSVNQQNSMIGIPKIATAALSIFAVLLITYALLGVAGLYAMASTMTLRFM